MSISELSVDIHHLQLEQFWIGDFGGKALIYRLFTEFSIIIQNWYKTQLQFPDIGSSNGISHSGYQVHPHCEI
jgi:hypothetical protein